MIPDDRDRHEDTKEGAQNNKGPGDLELESVRRQSGGGDLGNRKDDNDNNYDNYDK